jgi:hypothetical protein
VKEKMFAALVLNAPAFVYVGGEQEVPLGVTHAVIDPSVSIVRRRAFIHRYLVSVIFHDGVEIIEAEAFYNCESLRNIKLLGVREIGERAFQYCPLSDVDFGDKLETVGFSAFQSCNSLRSIKMPTVRSIDMWAFSGCEQLTEAEFGVNLERIGGNTFYNCRKLQRITIPLKSGLFSFDYEENRYTQFDECEKLTTIEFVGAERIHKTISSLLMKSWRGEMNQEIDRINRDLPDTDADEKTNAIRLWIRSVIDRLEHYKAEHSRLLKEHMTLLELAIWKAKLDERKGDFIHKVHSKRAKIDEESEREEKRITSGADIIIKNVLPFFKLA